MSVIGSFDRTQHLGELNSPLFTGNPVPVTPAQRKRLTAQNIGIISLNAPNDPAVVSAVNATATLTAAQLLGGLITSTSAAAVAMTLPTGAVFEPLLAAVYGTLAVGDGFLFTIINTGPNTVTLTAASGFTIGGGQTTPGAIATLTNATFRVVRTAANTYIAYRTTN